MTVQLTIHLEPASDTTASWWAESDDFPGFTAAADTLEELREFSYEAVRREFGPDVHIVERLADVDEYGVRQLPVTAAISAAA